MSKKKQIKKRIDDLFQDIQKEQTAPGESILTNHRAEDLEPRAAARQVIRKRQNREAVLAVPLRLGQQGLGNLEIIGDEEIWDEDAQLLAEQVADQLELALENATLFQETQRRAEELALLNRIASALSDYSHLEETLNQVGREITQAFDLDYLCFTLLDAHETYYTVTSCSKSYESFNPVGKRFSVQEPFVKELYALKDLVIMPRVDKRQKLNPLMRGAVQYVGTKTLLLMPIWRQNTLISVISMHSTRPDYALSEEKTHLLKSIFSQISNAIETARLFQLMQESEARFRDVALASADWVWEIDAEGKFTYCSDRVFNVLGYTPQEIVGKSPKDFVAPEDRAFTENLIKKYIAEGKPLHMASRLVARDGRFVILETNAIPIIGPDGAARGYRGVYKDITKRKQDEALQKAVFQITNASLQSETLQELLKEIHAAVNTVAPAKNFYIAIYDPDKNELRYPYFVDEHDSAPPDVLPLGNNLTSKVIREGKTLLLYEEDLKQLATQGQAAGPISVAWLGTPLRTKKAVVGVMAMQTYEHTAQSITAEHIGIFELLAPQVASAVERFLSAEALAQSENRLRSLFAAMDDVILVVGKDTTYRSIAPTNQAGLYRPPDDLLGQRMADIFDEEMANLFQNAIERAINTNQRVNIEYPLEIGGKTVWFDASLTKLNDDEVFWIARDITDRRQAEEALKRRNEYLATAAEVGRLITSTLDLKTLFKRTVNLLSERFGYYHVAIFTIEETGFNAILQEASGEGGRIMKEKAHSLPVGSKSLVGQVAEKGQAIIINDTERSQVHHFNPLLPETRAEAGIPLKIGSRIIGILDLQSKSTNAFLEDDIAVLEILADQIAVAIDNARSYELAQQAMLDMREADRMKSQFLANMSHELRTPLNSIIGFSRVILKGIDGPLTDLQHQDLTSIYNSGQHLLGLINDILDISRIEAGKMELSFDEVDAKSLIESVLSTARGLVKDKDVALLTEIPDHLPTIRADRMRVRQVLLNLVSNACKFTEEGSITVRAESQITPAGQSMVRISVIDTGPGISKEDQSKLFQPFSQVDASLTRKVGGSGLGLSISQKLIHMHGGEIGLQSEVGQGSTFYFTVPTYHQQIAQDTADASAAPRRSILSIDDDPQVIGLYQRYLQGQDWDIIPVTNPQDAVEKARTLHPDVITLDIMMPEINGWQILQALKKDPATRQIPIIVCSILEEEEKGFSLGAADYLTKPILQEDLLDALKRIEAGSEIRTILIIDDNPDDLRLLDKLLTEEQGYKTILANSGKSGWESIQTQAPDVIFLDIFLPDMDGFAILKQLHADETLRQIPVIIITGATLNSEQEHMLQEFNHDIMQKASISQEELLETLGKVLKKLENTD